MQLAHACSTILNQLTDVVRQVDEKDFSSPSQTLGHSTIGQHLRHTLEFFVCLEQGFESGVVNYDRRPHDKIIETDKFLALGVIGRIHDFVNHQRTDHPLALEVGYETDSELYVTIDTSYLRELTYNIEHAVHHMAIMKIGLREVAPYVEIPADFGIAASTIRYRDALVPSR